MICSHCGRDINLDAAEIDRRAEAYQAVLRELMLNDFARAQRLAQFEKCLSCGDYITTGNVTTVSAVPSQPTSVPARFEIALTVKVSSWHEPVVEIMDTVVTRVDTPDGRGLAFLTPTIDAVSPPKKGGAAVKASWGQLKIALKEEIQTLASFPDKSNPEGWRYNTDAGRFLLIEAEKMDEHPSLKTCCDQARIMMADFCKEPWAKGLRGYQAPPS
jgi:hypothetical protein